MSTKDRHKTLTLTAVCAIDYGNQAVQIKKQNKKCPSPQLARDLSSFDNK